MSHNYSVPPFSSCVYDPKMLEFWQHGNPNSYVLGDNWEGLHSLFQNDWSKSALKVPTFGPRSSSFNQSTFYYWVITFYWDFNPSTNGFIAAEHVTLRKSCPFSYSSGLKEYLITKVFSVRLEPWINYNVLCYRRFSLTLLSFTQTLSWFWKHNVNFNNYN